MKAGSFPLWGEILYCLHEDVGQGLSLLPTGMPDHRPGSFVGIYLCSHPRPSVQKGPELGLTLAVLKFVIILAGHLCVHFALGWVT